MATPTHRTALYALIALALIVVLSLLAAKCLATDPTVVVATSTTTTVAPTTTTIRATTTTARATTTTKARTRRTNTPDPTKLPYTP